MRTTFLASFILMGLTSCELQSENKNTLQTRSKPNAVSHMRSDDASTQDQDVSDAREEATDTEQGLTIEQIPASNLNWDGKTLGETPNLYIFAVE